jgi:hypothetical protein
MFTRTEQITYEHGLNVGKRIATHQENEFPISLIRAHWTYSLFCVILNQVPKTVRTAVDLLTTAAQSQYVCHIYYN